MRQKSSSGVQLGLGVKLAAVYRIHEQGNLSATDNTFDMAIQGKGFFQVTLPTGETAYTRDGTFQLNENGQVVTHDGYLLDPAITVPEDAIDVTVNDIDLKKAVELMFKIEKAPQAVRVNDMRIKTDRKDRSQLDLRLEGRHLHIPGREVAVVVQAALAHRQPRGIGLPEVGVLLGQRWACGAGAGWSQQRQLWAAATSRPARHQAAERCKDARQHAAPGDT